MDSTVIQEIANQLGMAVDQAGQFVTEQLPGIAALKMWQTSIPLFVIGVAFLIALIPTIVSIAIAAKQRKSDIKGKAERRYSSFYSEDWLDYPAFWFFIFAAIVTVCIFVGLLCAVAICVPQIIGWSNYPEAMLIDMALKAVG